MQKDSNSSVIGVIPARWASTRLPGKSLIPICGKPLIQWVVESARRSRRLARLVVATDDERIRDAVEELGAEAVMTRHDHPSGTDRVAEAVAKMPADVIINIQGDEPLMNASLIDLLADRMLADESWDMATAATLIDREEDLNNPSVVKVVSDQDGRALYFSRSPIPHVREKSDAQDTRHWWHLGIYAYRRSFLERLVATPPCMLEQAERLEQLRALSIGARILVIPTEEKGMGVDTPEDVQYVEQVIRALHGV